MQLGVQFGTERRKGRMGRRDKLHVPFLAMFDIEAFIDDWRNSATVDLDALAEEAGNAFAPHNPSPLDEHIRLIAEDELSFPDN